MVYPILSLSDLSGSLLQAGDSAAQSIHFFSIPHFPCCRFVNPKLCNLFLQFFGDKQSEHLASLILSAVLMISGFNFFIMGFLADLIGSNRYLIENILSRMKKHEINDKKNSELP